MKAIKTVNKVIKNDLIADRIYSKINGIKKRLFSPLSVSSQTTNGHGQGKQLFSIAILYNTCIGFIYTVNNYLSRHPLLVCEDTNKGVVLVFEDTNKGV